MYCYHKVMKQVNKKRKYLSKYGLWSVLIIDLECKSFLGGQRYAEVISDKGHSVFVRNYLAVAMCVHVHAFLHDIRDAAGTMD